MKSIYIISAAVIGLVGSQAYATDPATTAAAPAATAGTGAGADQFGGVPAGTSESMAGSPGLTRAAVYQELIRSQKNGETARMQDFYRGGN